MILTFLAYTFFWREFFGKTLWSWLNESESFVFKSILFPSARASTEKDVDEFASAVFQSSFDLNVTGDKSHQFFCEIS